MTSAPLPHSITLKNIHAAYGHHIALEDVNLTIKPQDFVAIIGPNGGGKSTLIKLICSLLHPSAGEIHFEGLDIGDIAYLPQQNTLDHYFPITVRDVVAMGLYKSVGPFRKPNEGEQARVQACIEEVGLKGFEDRQIATLSGGQFQRMLFARLMAQDAKVLLLDEPFSAIDDATTEKLIHLLIKWNKAGKTVAIVLHDTHLIEAYFEKTFYVRRTVQERGQILVNRGANT